MKHRDRGLHYKRTAEKTYVNWCPCANCRIMRREYLKLTPWEVPKENPHCQYVPPEKIFADAWEKENADRRGINYGMGILQDLMVTQRAAKRGDLSVRDSFSVFGRLRVAFEITPRERIIVATVIQWLGTNCGWGFLTECLRKCGWRLVRIEGERTTETAQEGERCYGKNLGRTP